MAIETQSIGPFAQAPLRDLHADTDIGVRDASYVLPEPHDLDPRQIEIIVDLDLDEMLLYYFGRQIPHDVEPVGDLVSYLVDSNSDRVVGVIVHEYVSRVIREYPALAEAMRWAIIVSGDQVREPGLPVLEESQGTGIVGRLKEQWHRRTAEMLDEQGRHRTAVAVRALLAAV